MLKRAEAVGGSGAAARKQKKRTEHVRCRLEPKCRQLASELQQFAVAHQQAAVMAGSIFLFSFEQLLSELSRLPIFFKKRSIQRSHKFHTTLLCEESGDSSVAVTEALADAQLTARGKRTKVSVS
jgi:hypothetical protein